MKDEADARAVNAEPWEPLPGMVKRECPECPAPRPDGLGTSLSMF